MSENEEQEAPRSRRSVLAAAAGATAAAVVGLAAPGAALAADPDDVIKNQDNATTELTSISQGSVNLPAFQANGNGEGAGLIGTTDAPRRAGVVGLAGATTGSAYDQNLDLDAGVYGFASQTDISSGLFAEGPTGVYAFGDVGVYADGGTVGVFASAYPQGTAVHAHAGLGAAPAPITNIALMGTVTSTNQAGIYARGRAMFPDRSGRTTITAGHSTKTVNIANVTSSNFAFAVLNSNRSGTYVRAVVPAAGKITIYLNKAVTSSTWISWLVLG